jgi:hypothetical protein
MRDLRSWILALIEERERGSHNCFLGMKRDLYRALQNVTIAADLG